MSVLPTHTHVLRVRTQCWRSSGEGTVSRELELVVAESTMILWRSCSFASVDRCEETL